MCCFFVMLVCLSGCTAFTDSETPGYDISGDNQYAEDVTKNHNDITIYQISEEALALFLQNGEFVILKDECISEYTYSDSVPWYVTWNASRFIIEQELLDFMGNYSNLEKYLSKHGVCDNIETLVCFEAPNTPVTIWVKTSSKNAFITINEKVNDNPYVYRFYTNEKYCKKYGEKSASLIVNRNEVISEIPVSLYFKHAHIPLVMVLKELGATFDWQTDTYAKLEMNQSVYYLDLTVPKLYESGKENENLLYLVNGSPICLHPYEKELLVDNVTLQMVCYQLGEKVNIKLNKNNLTVKINTSLF